MHVLFDLVIAVLEFLLTDKFESAFVHIQGYELQYLSFGIIEIQDFKAHRQENSSSPG